MKTVIHSPKIDQSRKVAVVSQDERHLEKLSGPTVLESEQKLTIDEDNQHFQIIIDDLKKKNLELETRNKQLQKSYDDITIQHNEVIQGIETLKSQAEKEGQAIAQKNAEKEVDEKKTEWIKIIEDLKGNASNALFDTKEDCVDIAYTAVCRIIGETAATREQVSSIIKETLKHITSNDKQVVYVSAHDYQLLAESNDIVDANVMLSNEIGHGGCIVKFGSGKLDARLELQLENLKKILLDTHNSSDGKQR
ncbi:putative flagellar assembly protein [gamma proteobacterium IMCC1989]|nr:putative flagellar assembly protein [gamma proteobacterium IMCC1989]